LARRCVRKSQNECENGQSRNGAGGTRHRAVSKPDGSQGRADLARFDSEQKEMSHEIASTAGPSRRSSSLLGRDRGLGIVNVRVITTTLAQFMQPCD
jgi:hypothetical protein